MENKTKYFIRFLREWDNISDAELALKQMEKLLSREDLTIGYFMPQPVYKSWVSNWVIRLITLN